MAGRVRWVLSTLTVLAISTQAPAALWINEALINVPGGGDNGFEFLELKSSTPSMSLAGLTLLYFEGNSPNPASGTPDQIINLGALSTGTNGLLLMRDAATVLTPAPNPATSLFVQDFNPDLENGGATIAIVTGWTGNTTSDIDADNDGIVDNTSFWTSVVDAIGWNESSDTAPLTTYASQLGGIYFPQAAFTPDAFTRINPGYAFFMDVLGANPGPYSTDPIQIGPENPGAPFLLTPGSENVPEPASATLLALSGLLVIRRRRAA